MIARALLILAACAGALVAQQPSDSLRAPSVPPPVSNAVRQPPLRDGDGAVVVGLGRDSALVGVGTATADSVPNTDRCTVARLRAQREMIRFALGDHIDSRITLSTSERTGTPVGERFEETITERVEGAVAGAALAAQWWEANPSRCRVALWLRLAAPAPAPGPGPGGASR